MPKKPLKIFDHLYSRTKFPEYTHRMQIKATYKSHEFQVIDVYTNCTDRSTAIIELRNHNQAKKDIRRGIYLEIVLWNSKEEEERMEEFILGWLKEN